MSWRTKEPFRASPSSICASTRPVKEPSQMVSLLQGQLGQGKAQADYKSLIDELRKAAKIEYFTDVEATVE